MKIAINGFGRIGRTFFRAAHKLGIKIDAVNDLCDNATLSYLLKYDSTYGPFEGKVKSTEDSIIVDGDEIKALGEADPKKLPWKDLGIDLVVESTGVFVELDKAGAHLEAGAKNVVITAPFKGDKIGRTFILGVNEEDYDAQIDKVASMASCTTNCLIPVADVLHKNFEIKKASMSTIHSFTMDQVLQDSPHKDPRRGRSALQSIIPTTSGATIAVAEVIPTLKDKMDGLSFRVPTATVSLLDFVALVGKTTTVEEVNQTMKAAAADEKYKGAITVSEEPLVSADLRSNPAGAIVDLSLTQVIDGDMIKVIAWYDNEMGYSIRLAEFCQYLETKIS
ncbi:MAG: type I glyceraldehyde-3-phosphate dehydrogenase [Candidatus Berkelbacteria bacterium]|nr:type I glyceraldehyde-3-phosphate dehydrogenase [Candidatus Berkelbacteria bacterium]